MLTVRTLHEKLTYFLPSGEQNDLHLAHVFEPFAGLNPVHCNPYTEVYCLFLIYNQTLSFLFIYLNALKLTRILVTSSHYGKLLSLNLRELLHPQNKKWQSNWRNLFQKFKTVLNRYSYFCNLKTSLQTKLLYSEAVSFKQRNKYLQPKIVFINSHKPTL